MAYKKHYPLHDFKEDARTRDPVQFTLIANIAAYRFERISYVASNQEGRQADMFSVGHYYNRHSVSNVWAHADGHHVRYYFGKPTEVCTLVPDVHATWVYYHEPFKLIGMKQGCPDTSRNMSAARRYEKAVFQMVVHFIFLLGGRLVYVSNSTNTDMLSHIKFAWTALEHSIKNESNASRAVLEQTRNSEDRDTMFKDQTELNRAVLDADGPISQDDRRIMTSSPSRSHLDAHNALPGQGSHRKHIQTAYR